MTKAKKFNTGPCLVVARGITRKCVTFGRIFNTKIKSTPLLEKS